jgi:hypothetical protein
MIELHAVTKINKYQQIIAKILTSSLMMIPALKSNLKN